MCIKKCLLQKFFHQICIAHESSHVNSVKVIMLLLQKLCWFPYSECTVYRFYSTYNQYYYFIYLFMCHDLSLCRL